MIRCATRTGAGRLHGENQDRLAADPEHGVFAVADGIGGLADAARTAQVVVDEFPRLVRESIPSLRSPTLADVVRTATVTLNERIRQEASAGPDNTGAATALLVVRDGLAMTVHLGDSRVYRVRHNALDRLTDDHASDGQLTRYLGMPGEVLPDVAVHQLVDGDRMLLCTDGLTKNVDDPVLGTVLNDQDSPGGQGGQGDQDSPVGQGGPDEVCDRLVAAAVERGAIDDVSVIAVEYTRGGGDNGPPGQR